MKKRKLVKAKPKTTLWYIGFWATIWWAVSGIYLVLLIWMTKNRYVNSSTGESIWNILKKTYTSSNMLHNLLSFIIIIWILGAIIWLIELRRQRISYKSAFKDLFLTIRK